MKFGRYNMVFTAVFGLMLSGAAGFNALVDPFGAYPSIHLDGLTRTTTSGGTRTARAELLRRGGWEFIIIGTSRAHIGYAPDHPVFDGVPGCNIALPGTNLYELQPMLDYALEHNTPREVLFGLDFLLFTDMRGTNEDFGQSRFAADRDLVSYHLEKLISARATVASAKSAVRLLRGARPKFSPVGQTLLPMPHIEVTHRKLFHDRLRSFFVNPETYGHFQYSGDRTERLGAMIRACRERGVAMTLIINPIHCAQHEAIVQSGLWPTFGQWLRDVAEVVEAEKAQPGGESIRLVSFLQCDPYGRERFPTAEEPEAKMEWWWESSHFKSSLGELVLMELYGDEPVPDGGFGVVLEPGNVDAHIADLEAMRAAWAAAEPEEAAFVADLARRHLFGR